MSIGRINVEAPGELDPKPTYEQSAMMSFHKPFYEALGMFENLVPSFSSKDSRRETADKLDVIDQVISDPRQGSLQNVNNTVTNLLGNIAVTAPLFIGVAAAAESILPIAASGFEIASPEVLSNVFKTPVSKLIRGTSGDIGKTARNFIGDISTDESLGNTLTQAASGFAGYKASTIPEHVVENYNKQNDTLDKSQIISDWSHDNLGFLIPAVPFLAGHTLFKMLRVSKNAEEVGSQVKSLLENHEQVTNTRKNLLDNALAETKGKLSNIKKQELLEGTESKLESTVKSAFESGLISKEHHDWYQEFLKDPKNPELENKAGQILKSMDVPIDQGSNSVWFKILKPEDVEALKSSIKEQVGNNFSKEDQKLLSDFVSKNAIDDSRENISSNTDFHDGLKGYSLFLDNKLEKTDKNDPEYNRQKTFNNVIKKYSDLVDSNAQKLADPKDVVSYLQKKIESTVPDLKALSETVEKLKSQVQERINKKPEQINMIDNVKKYIQGNEKNEVNRLFFLSDKRLKQFQENPSVLEELADCVGSKLNG